MQHSSGQTSGPFIPMRNLPHKPTYKKGDVLVLFGELFSRGYANGLVEEAERIGMTVVRATVGRRENGVLRPLNAEEASPIPAPFINVPLEAGFDMEILSDGQSICDKLKEVKLTDWQNFKISDDEINQANLLYQKRFQQNVAQFAAEVRQHIPPGANVLFAHLMAGGVPRAKIVMPLMNRVFKGTGDRHISSEVFWNSDIGKVCAANFKQVTAETLRVLIGETSQLREQQEKSGGKVSYLAYGYHGTEILFNDMFKWQSYTPYLQGWAKKLLEEVSFEAKSKNITSCVYNCPEILTNSSGIFLGVELSLYPLLRALKAHSPHNPKVKALWDQCASLLNSDLSLESFLKLADEYLANPLITQYYEFDNWPQHNQSEHMNFMLATSEKLFASHKDQKNLVAGCLSEVVFKECGKIMLHDAFQPTHPVIWLGHDILVKSYFES